MHLTSQLQRCKKFASATFIVHRELNFLSNVDMNLEQRCSFDVMSPTTLQRCVLVVQRWDLNTTLLQRRHTTLSQHCVFDGLSNFLKFKQNIKKMYMKKFSFSKAVIQEPIYLYLKWNKLWHRYFLRKPFKKTSP